MTARTHDAAAITLLGLAFLIAAPTQLSLSTVIIAIFANLIGGITPDIDQPTAPLWRNLPIGKFFGQAFAKLLGGHRFLTHSLLGLALAIFLFHSLLLFLGPIMTSVDSGYVTWAFGLGVLSHLLMDSLTKEGVPLLLPIPFKFGFPPIRSLRITTGSWLEIAVVFPLLIAGNAWIYFGHYDQFVRLLQTGIIR